MAKRKPKNEHAYGYWIVVDREWVDFRSDKTAADQRAKEMIKEWACEVDVCKVQTSYFKREEIIMENAE